MNRIGTRIESILRKYRWILHVLFWILISFLYVLFFGHHNSNYLQTFFFVGLLMPVIIATTYFLNYHLVPNYLMKERYGYFALYFIYTLLAAVYVEMLVVILTFTILADSRITNMSPASINILFLLVALLMVVFLGMGIKMLLHWKKSSEDIQKLRVEKIQTELKFLKTQLHPHFLFNTLNNLYYLALEKSDKTPAAILALSELLDYVLHDARANFVTVEKELKQVENYIALEALRCEERLTINIHKEKIEGKVIAPMVMITLIENAFKHGVMKTNKKAWIELSASSTDRYTTIEIRNSVESRKTNHQKSGIGLQNLKSQIDHIYRDKATLSIEQGEESFKVQLQLENQ